MKFEMALRLGFGGLSRTTRQFYCAIDCGVASVTRFVHALCDAR